MGLYDDDNAAVSSGDVLDVIYWQTKFAHLKLEAALRSRQPEGAVKGLIPDVRNGAQDVLQRYPNHGEVKGWLENAKKIEGKINPDAAYADFKADFAHWKDYSYEAGWRSYHIAKMAAATQDYSTADQHAREVITQFGRSLDRMGQQNWPAEVQQFVKTARPEMEKLHEEALAKR
jgi:hypothetical protein